MLAKKPDPELLPAQRPRCPKCPMRMVSTEVTDAADGFEDRTFECMKCGHVETKRMLADPLVLPSVAAWTNAGLKSPE